MSEAQLEAQLRIGQLTKHFGDGDASILVLNRIDFEARKGELITVIGPSGCGKSTLLKVIAGLDLDYEGSVILDGKRIAQPGIDKGFVFQDPRLFPWLNVEENIAADLSLRSKEVRSKVDQLLEIVRLQDARKLYPKQLSGGMAQRVAIARALLREPEILLLDEPFAALDAFTRSHLQEVLIDIWQHKKITMMLVTHDIDEAVFLANRVIVMNAKPGTIRRVIAIDLPYPRKKNSTSFLDFRKRVLGEFEQVEEPQLVGGMDI